MQAVPGDVDRLGEITAAGDASIGCRLRRPILPGLCGRPPDSVTTGQPGSNGFVVEL
jgi:hypothetical protein